MESKYENPGLENGWSLRAAEKLRESGYKLTPQRLKILEILERDYKRHPSFKELLEAVKAEMPTVSASTLYSFLLTLEKLGLIRLFSWEGETRVEVDTKPHINVLKVHSNEIVDVYDPELAGVIEERLRAHGIKGRLALINVVVYESNGEGGAS